MLSKVLLSSGNKYIKFENVRCIFFSNRMMNSKFLDNYEMIRCGLLSIMVRRKTNFSETDMSRTKCGKRRLADSYICKRQYSTCHIISYKQSRRCFLFRTLKCTLSTTILFVEVVYQTCFLFRMSWYLLRDNLKVFFYLKHFFFLLMGFLLHLLVTFLAVINCICKHIVVVFQVKMSQNCAKKKKGKNPINFIRSLRSIR